MVELYQLTVHCDNEANQVTASSENVLAFQGATCNILS